jgi:hypothetical protein
MPSLRPTPDEPGLARIQIKFARMQGRKINLRESGIQRQGDEQLHPTGR